MTQLIDYYDDVGPGWKKLLELLHTDISAVDPAYEVVQVKEKFGSLRVYLVNENDEIEQLLHTALVRSQYICEMCGEPGEVGGQYWVKTLCAEHREKDIFNRTNRWEVK